MPVQLGGGFTAPAPPPTPTGDERRHMELLAELAALRIVLHDVAQQPAPNITAPPPDLRELLYALEQINIPAPLEGTDPQAIGEAVALALQANRVEVPDRTDEVLEELKRIGRKFGVALANSAPVVSNDISSNPTRVLGQVEVTSAPLTKTDDDETQALLTLLRDEQMRRTDPLAAGANMIGYVAPSVAQKATSGKFFLADSGILTTTVTNNNAALTFTNPADSGKNAFIVAVTIETDQTAVWAKFVRSPTTSLPTTVKTAYNTINLLSSAPYNSSMIVRGDAMPTEMDGVTQLVARVTSNVSSKVDLPPFTVTQGTTIGLTVNLGGAGAGSVAVYYFEEAA